MRAAFPQPALSDARGIGSMLDRRNFMKLMLATQAFAAMPARASAPGLLYGDAKPFSHEWLKKHAEELAAAPYVAPPRPDPASSPPSTTICTASLSTRPTTRCSAMGIPAISRSRSCMSGITFRKPCGCTPWTRRRMAAARARSSTTRTISRSRPTASPRNCLPIRRDSRASGCASPRPARKIGA